MGKKLLLPILIRRNILCHKLEVMVKLKVLPRQMREKKLINNAAKDGNKKESLVGRHLKMFGNVIYGFTVKGMRQHNFLP
jgi:hypothetical protein